MKISDLFQRSPRVSHWLQVGQPMDGLDALRKEGVTTVEQLTVSILAGTPGFGRTSLEYLTLVLADEVLRMHRLIDGIHKDILLDDIHQPRV